ncbi:MAG: D-aminoacylase [Gemmatimonadota bacterium]|nr:D-aminoacylase [Gemmatimonadota bacterium]
MRFARTILLTTTVAAVVASMPPGADAQAARPCANEANRHFDFWEGRWMVRAATGALAGHNTISVALGECVIMEHYTTPSGYEGRSLNMFDASRGVWHQTWTDNGGLLLLLEGGYEGDRMVMSGETLGPNGQATLNRITWSRVGGDPDRVRQLWEVSSDGGDSWGTGFDGLYIRQSGDFDWDVLLRGGTVVDGSGQPRFRADVAVRGDRIVRVSREPLDASRADRVIDATGKIISPGFVDIHTHLDPLLRLPGGESHVRQGVTFALGGPDGSAPWPLDDYHDRAEALGLGLNVGFMVGHNTVRGAVIGLEDRAPTPAELERMKAMVARGMDDGAWGISTGLKYLPGAFSELPELVELSRVAADRGGFYTSHLREEGLGLIESVAEAMEIGRRADIPVVLTHHKVVGQPMWGASERTLAMVDSARAAGTDVMIDQYPYTASHSGITILIPAWAMEGGTEGLLARMDDDRLADSVLVGIAFNIVNDRGGNDLRRVQFSRVSWDTSLEGRTLHDWAVRDGLEPTPQTGARLVIEAVRRGGANAIYHAMSEDDVEAIMAHPSTMIGSDGRLVALGDGHPHPRWYGTFPRVLGLYTRERGVLTLEQAVRKMSGLPAERIGLRERGQVRAGWYADLVVFDPATVADRATFEEPHQYPLGIEWVLVNGQISVDDGGFVDARAGAVLKRGRN